MQYGSDLSLSLENLSKKIIDQYEFNCGNEYINSCYSKSMDNIETADFVFIDTNKNDIVAYFSLTCSAIMVEMEKSAINLVPAVEISIFALAVDYQGMPMTDKRTSSKLSKFLFEMIINRVYDFTEEYCGAGRVVLYSVPKAYNFYKKFGFSDFSSIMRGDASTALKDCIPMYYIL